MKNTKNKINQGIDRFVGMSWKTAQEELENNAHILVLGDEPDDRANEVANTYRDYGLKPAMAALCSHLYVKERGGSAGAMKGIEIYKGVYKSILKKKSSQKLIEKATSGLREMENLDYFCSLSHHSRHYPGKTDWPLEPKFTKIKEKAGFANVLLFVSMRELAMEGTSEKVAADSILKFLSRNKSK